MKIFWRLSPLLRSLKLQSRNKAERSIINNKYHIYTIYTREYKSIISHIYMHNIYQILCMYVYAIQQENERTENSPPSAHPTAHRPPNRPLSMTANAVPPPPPPRTGGPPSTANATAPPFPPPPHHGPSEPTTPQTPIDFGQPNRSLYVRNLNEKINLTGSFYFLFVCYLYVICMYVY